MSIGLWVFTMLMFVFTLGCFSKNILTAIFSSYYEKKFMFKITGQLFLFCTLALLLSLG